MDKKYQSIVKRFFIRKDQRSLIAAPMLTRAKDEKNVDMLKNYF
jgi:hypothetical protein